MMYLCNVVSELSNYADVSQWFFNIRYRHHVDWWKSVSGFSRN